MAVTPSVTFLPQSLVQSRKAGITSALASSTLNNEELVCGAPPLPELGVNWVEGGAPGSVQASHVLQEEKGCDTNEQNGGREGLGFYSTQHGDGGGQDGQCPPG